MDHSDCAGLPDGATCVARCKVGHFVWPGAGVLCVEGTWLVTGSCMLSGVDAAQVPIAVQLTLLLGVSTRIFSVDGSSSESGSSDWAHEGRNAVAISISRVLNLSLAQVQIEILALARDLPRDARQLRDEPVRTWKLRIFVAPDAPVSLWDKHVLAGTMLAALLGEQGLAFALSEELSTRGLPADGLHIEAMDQMAATVVEGYAMPLPQWLLGEWSACDTACGSKGYRQRSAICPLGSSAACEEADGPPPALEGVCEQVCEESETEAGFIAAVIAASCCCGCVLRLICKWCFRRCCRPRDEGQIFIRALHGISASYRVVRPATEAIKSGTVSKAFSRGGCSSKACPSEVKLDLEMGMESKKVRVIWDFDVSRASKLIGSQASGQETSDSGCFQRDSGSLRMMADNSIAASKRSAWSLGAVTTTTTLVTIDPCAFAGSFEEDPIVCHTTISVDTAATAKLAFVAGDRVEYYSKTHDRWLTAVVFKTTPISASASCPLRVVYDIKVGPTRQLRRDVLLEDLRLLLLPSEAVEQLDRSEVGIWRTARLAATQRAGFTTFGYSVLLSHGDNAGSGVEVVPATELRRRFAVGEAVEVYRGPEFGWLSGCVADISCSGLRGDTDAKEPRLRVQLSEAHTEAEDDVWAPAHLVRRRVREVATPTPTGGFKNKESFCSHCVRAPSTRLGHAPDVAI